MHFRGRGGSLAREHWVEDQRPCGKELCSSSVEALVCFNFGSLASYWPRPRSDFGVHNCMAHLFNTLRSRPLPQLAVDQCSCYDQGRLFEREVCIIPCGSR